MVRAGSCSATCSRNNGKNIAVRVQTNARRAQSLDDVAKTEHSNGLPTHFLLVATTCGLRASIARFRDQSRRTLSGCPRRPALPAPRPRAWSVNVSCLKALVALTLTFTGLSSRVLLILAFHSVHASMEPPPPSCPKPTTPFSTSCTSKNLA